MMDESIQRLRSKAIGEAFQMKFTFEEKLAAVKLHKEKGIPFSLRPSVRT